MRTRLVSFSLLLLSSLVATSAGASELESRIDAYLGSMEKPVSAAQWKALGPDALPILERHAFSANAMPTQRARAAEALGLAGTLEHGEKLLSLSNETSAPLLVRTSALRGAGRLLSAERIQASVVPLVSNGSEPRIRATAADVVAERMGMSGCALVRKQVRSEPPGSQHAFSVVLKRCARTKP